MSATRPECAGDFRKRPPWIEDVLEYVLSDDQIKLCIPECLVLEIFAAKTMLHFTGSYFREEVRSQIVWTLAFQLL